MSNHRCSFDLIKVSNAVKEVDSWRGLALRLGMSYPSSTVYRSLRPFCAQHKIDTSHFLGQSSSKGKVFKERRRDISVYLSNEQPIGSHALKKRLLDEGLKKHQCEKCQRTEWNGLPIPIQLHHVDGNSGDNSLNNLLILCANCHAQTENYCGRNIERSIKSYVEDTEIITQIPLWSRPSEVLRILGLSLAKPHYDRIRKLMNENPELAFKKTVRIIPDGHYRTEAGRIRKKGDPTWRTKSKPHLRKVEHPSKEELTRLVWERSMCQLGRDYGVSDNAVRSWCKRYGIADIPPMGYWRKRMVGQSHEQAIGDGTGNRNPV